MSYVVARMAKYKSGQLTAIYNHNERIFKNHSNKEIDVEKSHLNYELTNRDQAQNYHKSISMKIAYLLVESVKMLYSVTNGLLLQIKRFLTR